MKSHFSKYGCCTELNEINTTLPEKEANHRLTLLSHVKRRTLQKNMDLTLANKIYLKTKYTLRILQDNKNYGTERRGGK